nr:MAG TPA: hypothetical protein [Caudoviricetes sp.]DAS09902.1 MAG TPA: hypothetical protein [Caudoviricetes sp.]
MPFALHQPLTLFKHLLFSQYTSVNRIHLVPFFFCITIYVFIIDNILYIVILFYKNNILYEIFVLLYIL